MGDEKQCGKCGMCHVGCCRGVAWSGIFAGAFVALGLSFLINLLLASIGISLFNPSEGLMALAVVGYIIMLIVAFVVMYVGGFVAGHLSGGAHRGACGGLVYGFTTWSLALLLAAVVASGMGSSVASSQSPLVNTAIINLPSGGLQALGQGQKGTAAVPSKAPAATAHAQAGNEGGMTAGEKMVQHFLGTSLFLTFLVFLVGAIGACIGGAVGNRPCRKDEKM